MADPTDPLPKLELALEKLVCTVECMHLTLEAALQRIAPMVEQIIRQTHDATPAHAADRIRLDAIVEQWLNDNSSTFKARYGADWRIRLEAAALRAYGPRWKECLATKRRKRR